MASSNGNFSALSSNFCSMAVLRFIFAAIAFLDGIRILTLESRRIWTAGVVENWRQVSTS